MSNSAVMLEQQIAVVEIDDNNIELHVSENNVELHMSETGPQGPRGIQGLQGDQGIQGEKGDKGDKGDPGAGVTGFSDPLTYDGGTGIVGLDIDPTTLEVGPSGLTVVGAGNANTLDGFDSTYFLNTSADAQNKAGSLSLEGTGTMEILDLNEASMTAKVSNIGATTPILIDSFSAADYRSAEYILQFSQGSLNFGMTRLMLLHNGLNEIVTSEYSSIETGTNIPYTFDATFSLGNVEVTISCPTASVTAVSLKFSRVLFDV